MCQSRFSRVIEPIEWSVCVCVCVYDCVYLYVYQFSSVTQLCLTLCGAMDWSMPGLPVHHQLPEFTQTHVLWVSDAIQPSRPLSSPSPPAFNLSQHQELFYNKKDFFLKKGRTNMETPGRQRPVLLLTAVILKGSSQETLAGQQKEKENERRERKGS